MTSHERALRLVRGEPTDRLVAMPIFMTWISREIGRPYRDYVTDHRVLVAAQEWLVEEFSIDSVSVISDAWREAADCGAEIVFWEDAPPACKRHLLEDKAGLATLRGPDPLSGGRMTDRVQAVAALHQEYGGQVPVMGWIEGPMAEACCLRGINEMMLDLIDDPAFAADLLDFSTEVGVEFALAQVKAGADIIGMGDAAASLCGPRFYERLVLPRERRIADAVHEAGALVRLHVCGDTNGILAPMATGGADIIDLDYPVHIDRVRPEMGDRPIIAGNFDPVGVLLNGTPDDVTAACRQCHQAFGSRHIVCAGCEVPRNTPTPNVRALFDYARTAGG
jgi:MtaA/CmuA family methyltransferase